MSWAGSRGLEPGDVYLSVTSLETKRALGRKCYECGEAIGRGDAHSSSASSARRDFSMYSCLKCSTCCRFSWVVNGSGELCVREHGSLRNRRSILVEPALSLAQASSKSRDRSHGWRKGDFGANLVFLRPSPERFGDKGMQFV